MWNAEKSSYAFRGAGFAAWNPYPKSKIRNSIGA
jgi:hypothetical protein